MCPGTVDRSTSGAALSPVTKAETILLSQALGRLALRGLRFICRGLIPTRQWYGLKILATANLFPAQVFCLHQGSTIAQKTAMSAVSDRAVAAEPEEPCLVWVGVIGLGVGLGVELGSGLGSGLDVGLSGTTT